MTVAENLAVGELIGGPKGRKLLEPRLPVLPALKDRRSQLAGTMSGGEQQQLAIGRVLIGKPCAECCWTSPPKAYSHRSCR